MNIVALSGRLTKDPEIRYSQGEKQTCIASYTLAVDRGAKDDDGNWMADFIRCTAIGANGEFASKYMRKGRRYNVLGRWQTGSYTNKDGQKVYTNECFVQRQEFADGKTEDKDEQDEGFMAIPEAEQEKLPFLGEGSQ